MTTDEIQERELPADKFGALPEEIRKRLVQMHVMTYFSKGLDDYPCTGPKEGMPLSTADVLVSVARWRRQYKVTAQKQAETLNAPLSYVLAMEEAIDKLLAAGIDPEQIYKR